MPMAFADLRVFVAVCQAGSLSAVARDLSCTQSAVSQHVKRLERATGVRLLERRPRGVVPTPEGRVLRSAAHEGITGLDLALRRLGELARGETGPVRVATGATSVRHFMSEAVVAFRHRLPENSSSRAHLDTAFARLGARLISDTGAADWDTAILLAGLGMGRAVVPALPGQAATGPVRFLPLPELPPLPVGWAVRRWTALNPPVRSFADLVEEQHGAA